MKTFTIDAYEAYTNSELNEGTGHDVHIGYFTNESDAKRATEGKGVMGTEAGTGVKQVFKTINICESYHDYIQLGIENLKKTALNKLSLAEREALRL